MHISGHYRLYTDEEILERVRRQARIAARFGVAPEGSKPDSELPQVEDMVGIWNLDETGDQYIRRMRDS